MNNTVLVADSDPEWVDVAARYLSRHGYDVATAINGLECLSVWRKQSPEIMVLEDEMLWGGSDGFIGVVREAENGEGIYREKDLTIIVTTTRSTNQIKGLYHWPHVSAVLRKPFGLSELREQMLLTTKTLRPKATNFRSQVQQLLAATIAPGILRSATKPLK
ncbi:hypothetical protein CA13_09990 [Planctomycetes bacterium CA13]|uniref:Response regulatory domain-containing protein n=1 Tax=Novipirellula herctigrandis TaxID=2527986 RepID=A0A5C5YX48_9BACT|nr:hypothetical protein CA13_09990 [Planctomycetes bacterium CA13]